jgi:hypothetical protein
MRFFGRGKGTGIPPKQREPVTRKGNNPTPFDRKNPRRAINREPAARWQRKMGIPTRILLGCTSFLAGYISVHLRYSLVFFSYFYLQFSDW